MEIEMSVHNRPGDSFKQPYKRTVETALINAVSVCWDGCHKIYIAFDNESDAALGGSLGYETFLIDHANVSDSLDRLFGWWQEACGLRFITGMKNVNELPTIIGQFEYEDEGVQ